MSPCDGRMPFHGDPPGGRQARGDTPLWRAARHFRTPQRRQEQLPQHAPSTPGRHCLGCARWEEGGNRGDCDVGNDVVWCGDERKRVRKGVK